MDNKTMRALVIHYRDVENMTFQAISDRLAEEHGYVRSRQALQKMYKSSIKREELRNDELLYITDIVNIYSLGYDKAKTRIKLNSFGYDIQYYDVIQTIKNEQKFLNEVRQDIINKIKNLIEDDTDIEKIKNTINYKDIYITDKKLKEYITEVYKLIIRKNVASTLANAYNLTGDRELIRMVLKDIELNDISIGEIKEFMY